MSKTEDLKKDNLVLPVYLNEEVIVDMLAIIENGFSYVSNISIVSSEGNQSDGKLDADAGISGLFNRLLKIDVSGSYDQKKQISSNQTETKQRVHTFASLFSKLRNYLISKNQLIYVNKDNLYDIKPGCFIEAEGSLERNPAVSILDDYLQLMDIVMMFSTPSELGKRTKSSQEKSNIDKNIKIIKKFSESLKVDGMEDFIMSGDISIVMSAQNKYFSKDNLSELIGGQFKVLGKVIQVFEKENIDLLRKTPWSLLPDKQKEEFKSIFQADELKEFNVPEYKAEVEAPALTIIPIAIFA